MLVDLTTQLDQTHRLLRQLLAAKRGTRSNWLRSDQMWLVALDTIESAAGTEPQK